MQLLWAGLIAASVSRARAASQWVYADAGQTEANDEAQRRTWGDACNTGREQSPINIDTKAVKVSESLPNIRTVFTARLKYVKNTGHGFQLFETHPNTHGLTTSGKGAVDATGTPKGYSVIGGETYAFYQVHWHSPSENTIDGKSYPLEAHFVHQLNDQALHGTYHRLAVIGLMYELGDCNPALEKFWSMFPEDAGATQYSGPAVNLDEKLAHELEQGYYHWYGSLTTPPCTEGVSWNLLRATETVCQSQVDKITKALAATQQGIGFNNRVVQPLNHRVVAVTADSFENTPLAEEEAMAAPMQAKDSTVSIITLVFAALVLVAAAVALVRV